ncbi:hypothetical protein HYV50_05125 [Candidatus Pacearchaeota archaeon]|nr:hypothetical protein [Candidatus Pacearchaeota archaeon]
MKGRRNHNRYEIVKRFKEERDMYVNSGLFKLIAHKPEDFQIDMNLESYMSCLESIDPTGTNEIFIDTNMIIPNDAQREWNASIPFFSDRDFKDPCAALLEQISSLVDFYSGFFNRENIVIIPEVRNEILIQTKYVRKRIREFTLKGVRQKLVRPVNKLEEVVKKNTERFEQKSSELHDFVEYIHSLIPSSGYSGYSAHPSETDKRLVATPLAIGLVNGGLKILLSNDGATAEAINKLKAIFRDNPKALRFNDYSPPKEPFVICAYKIKQCPELGFFVRRTTIQSFYNTTNRFTAPASTLPNLYNLEFFVY